LAGTIIQSLLVLNKPDYVFQRWHGSLLSIMIVFIAALFNTVLARKLPLVEGLLVFCHVLGVAIVIPLLVLLPRRSGGAPLVEFFNPNEWMSNGVATWVGMLSTIIALIGFDCSVHMSEETKDSSRTIPVTLLTGFGANAVLGFFVLMSCIYTIGPLETALFESATGYPFIDMFYQATGSLAATDVMTTIVIINFTASAIAVMATASRQLWAFARNGGVPFSRFLAPICCLAVQLAFLLT
jgi:amino acid transporter